MAGQVQLSSLRVSAEMDATGYKSGADAIEAANKRMADSGQSAGAAFAAQDAAAGRTGGTLSALSRQYADGYSGSSRFTQQVGQLGTQMEMGNATAERAAQIYTGLTAKFNQYADATKAAVGGNRDFASVIDQVNAKAAVQIDVMNRLATAQQSAAKAQTFQTGINQNLGVLPATSGAGTAQASADAFLADAGGLAGVAKARAAQAGQAFTDELNSRLVAGVEKSAKDSAAAFQPSFDELDRIAKAKAQQIGQNFTQDLNTRLIAPDPKSAKESAAVYQEQAKAVENLKEKYLPLYSIQQQYLGQLKEIRAAGPEVFSTENQRAGAIQRTKDAFAAQVTAANSATQATTGFGGAAGLGSTQSMALFAALRHSFDAMAAGIPITRVLAMEAGNLSYGLSSAGGVAGSVQAVFTKIGEYATPFRLVAGAAVAIGAGALYAGVSWASGQRDIEKALVAVGARSGATVSQINQIAQASSSMFGLSATQAAEAATEFAKTGNISVNSIKTLTDATQGFSILVGKDTTAAAADLAKIMGGDLVSAAMQLNQTYGTIDGKTLEYIRTLQNQGDRQQAIQVIMDKIAPTNQRAVESLGTLEQAWNLVGNAIDRAKRAVGSAGAPLPPQEEIARLTAQREQLQNPNAAPQRATDPLRAVTGILGLRGADDATKQIDVLQKKLDSINADAADKQLIKFADQADASAKALVPQIGQIQKLEDELSKLQAAKANPEIAGRQGFADQNDAAIRAAQLTLVVSKEQAAEADRYNVKVQEIAAGYGDVSTKTTLMPATQKPETTPDDEPALKRVDILNMNRKPNVRRHLTQAA
jgi:hypothetical protein